ncbi:hypothetical protein JKP88DRAFT_218614 [Tribonema minus]|uniref:Uncharacterized protein n=1 Tax=Tribonema minus TaxID=303371 RepID=A0A835ZC42_9STRA|nr:hypothetical protein JKP88DRAFT_218614 [Tribonema minus]
MLVDTHSNNMRLCSLLALCHCARACPRGTKCRCPPQLVCPPASVCPPPSVCPPQNVCPPPEACAPPPPACIQIVNAALGASDRRAPVADAACEHWPTGGNMTKTAVFCKKLFIAAWALGVPLSLQALPGLCAGSRLVESKDDVVLFLIKSA